MAQRGFAANEACERGSAYVVAVYGLLKRTASADIFGQQFLWAPCGSGPQQRCAVAA